MRALFLVNPRARRVAKRGSALRSVADKTGTPLRLLDENFAPGASADRVYIEGGDGTVRWVISRYIETGGALPEFAVVRGGTTDQIAGVLGLRRPTNAGIVRSLEEGPATLASRLIRVESERRVEHGFVFSTGAIPNAPRRIESYKGLADLSGAALVGRALIDAARPNSPLLEASPARVEADLPGEHVVFDGEHVGVIATPLPSLYMGLDPFWGEEPGNLRVTYAGADAHAVLPSLAGLWAGRVNVATLRARGFESFNTSRLSVRATGAVLDGETLEGERFTLSCTPEVRFFR